jgi:hypothetical protein
MHRRLLAVPVALLLAVSGCASGDETPDTGTTTGAGAARSGSPSATTSAQASAAATTPPETQETRSSSVEISVAIAGGNVRPKTQRVKIPQDSRVRLLITSDVDDEVHVHGYDLEETLEAGRTATIEFVADQQGVFEVETHEKALTLIQLEVR